MSKYEIPFLTAYKLLVYVGNDSRTYFLTSAKSRGPVTLLSPSDTLKQGA